MTSNELINELQKLDPGPVAKLSWWERVKLAFAFATGKNCLHLTQGGDTPVCISNQPIVGVDYVPAYYDGDLMEVNTSRNHIHFTDQGKKLVLIFSSLDDIINDNPKATISYSSERVERNNAGKVQAAKLLISDYDFF